MENNNINQLRDTIVPKSDQLNADDLITGPLTVKITAVKRGPTPEQPVAIHIEGRPGTPYYPCKSMRRVIIAAWGDNGNTWSSRSMTLYRDPDVSFGGVKVGGIRISHLSDITTTIALALTVTRSKRAMFKVEPLLVAAPRVINLPEILAMIEASTTMSELKAAGMAAKGLPASDADIARIAYEQRMAALKSAK